MHETCPICYLEYSLLYNYKCCKQPICKNCISIIIYNDKSCPYCRTYYDNVELFYKVKKYFNKKKTVRPIRPVINYIQKNINEVYKYKNKYIKTKY